MKILLVGPLPEPINGCSYANDVFRHQAANLGEIVDSVNTSTSVIAGQQGHFSLGKVAAFVRCYFKLPIVLGVDVLYITPGQTFLGLVKYAPYMALAAMLRRPYVLHVHGNHLGRNFASLKGVKRCFFQRCVSAASAGIVLSDTLKANFAGLLPPERVFVVENFAGDELFDAVIPTKPNDQLNILWLSNLMREKGIFEFIEALGRLKSEGRVFKACIAGRMECGIESELREKLGVLSPEVEYVGPVTGQVKIDLLVHSNVFVLPTYYTMEGQPIALLEAMACGNILVTTRHAGIPDIVNESNGYLLPVRDVDALAACFRHIADQLTADIQRVSAYNRSSAKNRFTERAFTTKILDVLHFAIGERSRAEIP